MGLRHHVILLILRVVRERFFCRLSTVFVEALLGRRCVIIGGIIPPNRPTAAEKESAHCTTASPPRPRPSSTIPGGTGGGGGGGGGSFDKNGRRSVLEKGFVCKGKSAEEERKKPDFVWRFSLLAASFIACTINFDAHGDKLVLRDNSAISRVSARRHGYPRASRIRYVASV